MISYSLAIKGYASINAQEIISHDKQEPMPIAGNFESLSRPMVYSQPYNAFGRFSIAEKLVFSVCSLALSGCTAHDQVGISLGTEKGSLSTDTLFWKSVLEGFPSPALFPSTLPSSPCAEAAIALKCKGPIRVLCGQNATSHAMACAIPLITTKSIDMLVVEILESSDQKLQSASALYFSSHNEHALAHLTVKTSLTSNQNYSESSLGELYLNTMVSAIHTKSRFESAFALGLTHLHLSL